MAQRYFDTNKFKDQWYRKLPPKLKCLWEHILCECSHFGVVYLDIEVASILIGEEILLQEFADNFSGRLVHLDENKFFIPKFINFQYKSLNTKNKATKSVIENLLKNGIELTELREDEQKFKYYSVNEIISSTSLAPSLGLSREVAPPKDKDKEKDKDKAKVKAKEKDKAKEKASEKSFLVEPVVIQNLWNTDLFEKHNLRECQKITPKRITAIKKFEKEIGFKTQDEWERYFTKISESDFLTGKKGEWKATFDWVLKLDNAIKIIEENYTDNQNDKIDQNRQSKFEKNRQAAIAYINTPREDDDEEI